MNIFFTTPFSTKCRMRQTTLHNAHTDVSIIYRSTSGVFDGQIEMIRPMYGKHTADNGGKFCRR